MDNGNNVTFDKCKVIIRDFRTEFNLR